MSELPTVAVIGTGRMGAAMAVKLREAGAEVVLFNRTADKAHQLAAETGARVAASAALAELFRNDAVS
jgi:3-hydroxyisobutyrate dehydrogenase/2-hydroxy-3-oxopropionate reductase